MRLLFCVVAVWSLLDGTFASAQGQSLADRFRQLDRNNDGEVTKKETGNAEWFDRFLKQVDANGDGKIQRTEILQNRQKRPKNAAEEIAARKIIKGIRYKTVANVNPERLSLDLYLPNAQGDKKSPTMIWVHGGSWKAGDKRSITQTAMLNFYLKSGWNFVSINYRLLPEGRHPNNAEDVAAAIAWVHKNIANYGGNPDAISISGHSAGGHLVGLIATNPRFLGQYQIQPSQLASVILFDPAVLDVARMLPGLISNRSNPYVENFGETPDAWKDGSPAEFLGEKNKLPRIAILLAYGLDSKTEQSRTFTKQGNENGHQVHLIDAFSFRSHSGIVSEFGKENDPVAKSVRSFLENRSPQSRTATLNPDLETLQMGRREIAQYQFRLMIRHSDRNRDGRFSSRELPASFRKQFQQLDQNGDQQIDQEELAKAYLLGPLLPPIEKKSLRSKKNDFSQLKFQRDYKPGKKDRNGQLLGGVECNAIEGHKNQLFATVSTWKAVGWTTGETTGPQILIKRKSDSEWEVDHSFGPRFGRCECLKSIRFTTDRQGRPLNPPVVKLLAPATSFDRTIGVWERDDDTENWILSRLGTADSAWKTEIRSMADHIDSVTGVHHIFAPCNDGVIFRGAYDSQLKKIVWDKKFDMDQRDVMPSGQRMPAITVADGNIFVSTEMDPTRPGVGGVFRRIDGPNPKWEHFYEWKHVAKEQEQRRKHKFDRQVRGLTPVDSNDGSILLAARPHTGEIFSLNSKGESKLVLDVKNYLRDAFSSPRANVYDIAVNEFVTVLHPETGEKFLLAGLWAAHPDGDSTPKGNSSWFLIRNEKGEWSHGRVWDSQEPIPNRGTRGGLRTTRTICVSPFPEEKGRVLYFGGFQSGLSVTNELFENTAWIYRAELSTSKSEQ